MIGTHNSAITQAYGFGIEQDYISELLPDYPVYTSDNLGEGVFIDCCVSVHVSRTSVKLCPHLRNQVIHTAWTSWAML